MTDSALCRLAQQQSPEAQRQGEQRLVGDVLPDRRLPVRDRHIGKGSDGLIQIAWVPRQTKNWARL